MADSGASLGAEDDLRVWSGTMGLGSPDFKELGFYFALAQVGFEMVAPIGLGAALDYYLHWTPWGVVAGAVLGLIGGLAHLVALINRDGKSGPSKPGGGNP